MVRFPLDGSTQPWIWQEIGLVDSFVFVVLVELCQVDYIGVRRCWGSTSLSFRNFWFALLRR
jgi:hypothetical protein